MTNTALPHAKESLLAAVRMAIANNIALTTLRRRKARSALLRVQWWIVIPVELALLAAILRGWL